MQASLYSIFQLFVAEQVANCSSLPHVQQATLTLGTPLTLINEQDIVSPSL